MIGAAVGLRALFDPPILALAIGVLIAGVAQLAFQLPYLKTRGYLPRPNFQFGHPAMKRIGLLMIPAVGGLAVYNLNVLVSKHLASLLGDGPVTWMYYADRLMELPLGVFAIAFGTAVLPSMSRLAATGRKEEIKHALTFSLRMVFFVILPATVGLIALRVPIVNVLFEHGRFGHDATLGTALALKYYCVGLWAFSTARILVPTFYAMEDFKTPVKVSVVALLINAAAGLVLIGPVDVDTVPVITMLAAKLNLFGAMRQGGLALATALASTVQVLLLFAILRRRLGPFGAQARGGLRRQVDDRRDRDGDRRLGRRRPVRRPLDDRRAVGRQAGRAGRVDRRGAGRLRLHHLPAAQRRAAPGDRPSPGAFRTRQELTKYVRRRFARPAGLV